MKHHGPKTNVLPPIVIWSPDFKRTASIRRPLTKTPLPLPLSWRYHAP